MRAFGTLRILAKPPDSHEQNIDIGMPIEDIESTREIAGIVQVVVIEESEDLSARHGDPGILCRRSALRTVVCVDACPRMPRDNTPPLNCRRRRIVDDNGLPVDERLRLDAAQCFLEQRQPVVRWNDDADPRRGRSGGGGPFGAGGPRGGARPSKKAP